ncbi:hypothetical protein [Calidithermus chliarophilus]|uniref:hypothetical protein n=1 Tax=Calidithermus chliarophilus TaxID=52023 RepID=UPI0012F6493B|nr:hypothetical protein [Calidithermus chliarophilus]
MRAERLSRLEAHARSSHSAAWASFWSRFRATLDGLPAGMFEGPFKPVELDDFSDLEDALAPWDAWADAALPVLERGQSDLALWPTDLPLPPSDPRPLLLEVVSRWRKNPRLPLAALVTLLGLGAARWGEGG